MSYWNSIVEIFMINTPTMWITAWGILVLTILTWRRLRARLFPYLYTLTGDTITNFDDAIMLTLCELWPWFYGITGLRIATKVLTLPEILSTLCEILFVLIVVGQLWQGVVRVALQLMKEQWFEGDSTHNYTLLSITIKIVFWSIIVLLVLTNLGIQITPLLASVWVIGIAISFALQSILEDLFASVSIYLDKPFRIGDYITMWSEWWTVEYVGIKTTRIRTILWEELVIANRKLTESMIHNYGKIDERTITHEVVVSFDTAPQLQTAIPNLIKQSMEFSELIDFKRCHLIEIGKYGLIYKRRYTLRTAEYDTHLQIQEKILMNILERIEQKWITIEKQFTF